MGGKVFKNSENKCLAVRFSKDEHQNIFNEIIQKINFEYNNSQYNYTIIFEKIDDLKDKESFGDIDILYSKSDNNRIEYNFPLMKVLGLKPEQIKTNGIITHVLFKDQYQIDFIKIPWQYNDKTKLYWAKFYFSYSIGMLLGIIARHFGLKLGFDGISIRESDTYIPFKNLTYSNIWTIVSVLFELDGNLVEDFQTNPTEENLFKLIWSSPFVSMDLFKDSLASCKHRKREADNAVFKKFFKTISTFDTKTNVKYIPSTDLEVINFWKDKFNFLLLGMSREIDFDDVLNKHYTFDDVLNKHYATLYLKEKMPIIKAKHYNFYKFCLDAKLNNLSKIEAGKLYGKFRTQFDIENMNQPEIKQAVNKFMNLK